MELKVQVVREPVKKYDKQRLEVEVPCPGKDEGITWKARFTEDQLAEITTQATKKIENNEEWAHIIYAIVWSKMKAKTPKLESIHPDMFKYVDEVLIAFSAAIIKMQGLDKVKPKQGKLTIPK